MKCRIIFSLFLLVGLTGCSTIGALFNSTANPAETSAESPTESPAQLPPPTEQQVKSDESSVEIIWAIPQDPVDGFIIRYGITKAKLDHELKLKTNEIEKFQDPSHGQVYRHRIEKLSSREPVFVSLIAFTSTPTKGEVLSSPTEIIEVAPAP